MIPSSAFHHNPGACPKTEKVKRPTIALAGTSEDWGYFVSRWTDCKKATQLEGPNINIQLLECCDKSFIYLFIYLLFYYLFIYLLFYGASTSNGHIARITILHKG